MFIREFTNHLYEGDVIDAKNRFGKKNKPVYQIFRLVTLAGKADWVNIFKAQDPKLLKDKLQRLIVPVQKGVEPVRPEDLKVSKDGEFIAIPELNIVEATVEEGTRCWKGYKKKGMKTMFGKRVPNCVKNEDKDIPCPACGDPKCDHKEDHLKEEVTSGNRNIALNLPRGEMKVLKAEEKDYDRGLLVKLLNNGGYQMAYWYEKHVPFPVEVIVDGKSVKKDAEIVEMKFHPELTPGAEDKGMRFKLYDIEADIKDLKDKIANIKNESINETIEFAQDLNALLKGMEEDLANREREIEENLRSWFGKGKKGGAGGGGWDRYNTKGERIGKCGDSKKGEGKPKCLSKSRAASLRAKGGKKAIGAAVSKKRRNDPNKNRKGKAKNVSNTVGKKKK